MGGLLRRLLPGQLLRQPASGWTPLELEDGWEHDPDRPVMCRERDGCAEVRGDARTTSSHPADGVVIARLPRALAPGYRIPPERILVVDGRSCLYWTDVSVEVDGTIVYRERPAGVRPLHPGLGVSIGR